MHLLLFVFDQYMMIFRSSFSKRWDFSIVQGIPNVAIRMDAETYKKIISKALIAKFHTLIYFWSGIWKLERPSCIKRTYRASICTLELFGNYLLF